jgi:putative glycosyltransferase (TIGR04372 family)
MNLITSGFQRKKNTKLGIASPRIFSSYSSTLDNYNHTALALLVDRKHDELIKLTRTFLDENPTRRRFIISILNKLQINYGYSSVFKELVKIYIDSANKLMKISCDQYGLPPCFEEYWAFRRIGELTEQTAYSHFMQRLNPDKQRPVIGLSCEDEFQNSAFSSYLSDGFEVITTPADVEHVRQISSLSPFSTFYYKYSDSACGHNNTFYGDIYSDLVEKKLDFPAFCLKDYTYQIARSFLKNYDLLDSDDFVLLHLREDGLVNLSSMKNCVNSDDMDYHRFRNTSPLDYIEAIDWLLSLGLKVVRIGHPRMTPLPNRKGLIDLTSVKRPGDVDIYLSAKAKFYYGSLSGPYSIFRHFSSRKALLANCNNYGLSIPNCFMQLRPIFDETSKKILTFKQIEELDLTGITAAGPYLSRNLKPISLTSEDHLRSVKDMIEYIEEGDIFRANQAMKVRTGRQKLLMSFTSDSLKLLED